MAKISHGEKLDDLLWNASQQGSHLYVAAPVLNKTVFDTHLGSGLSNFVGGSKKKPLIIAFNMENIPPDVAKYLIFLSSDFFKTFLGKAVLSETPNEYLANCLFCITKKPIKRPYAVTANNGVYLDDVDNSNSNPFFEGQNVQTLTRNFKSLVNKKNVVYPIRNRDFVSAYVNYMEFN
jgi:hypothetical protein